MSKEDWGHHIFFVYIGTCIASFYKIGYFMPLYHTFSSGLPGGILYMCLVIEDLKWITRTQRLRIASVLNVWIRSLGLSLCFILRLVCFLQSNHSYADYIALIVSFLTTTFNGQYYMEQVIRADELQHTKNK